MANTKNWEDPITVLSGIGSARAQAFHRLGVLSIRDLLFFFPFRFEDLSVRDVSTLTDKEQVTLKGRIISTPTVSYFGKRRSRLVFNFALSDHDIAQVVFFNQPYLKKQLEVGQEVAIHGQWQGPKAQLTGMKVIQLGNSDNPFSPVYRTTKGLSQAQIVQAIQRAFEDYGTSITEIVPEYLNDRYCLCSLPQALYYMHFPERQEDFEQAKRKVIYQEFFLYQFRLQLSSQRFKQEDGVQILYDVDQLRQVIDMLPFELTDAQKRAVNAIHYDLRAPYPMQMMLQGDVGSGKTLVAFLAMVSAVQSGFQTTLMVPTEILAKQHVESFNQVFESIGLRAEILIGSQTKKERQNVLDGLATGRIRLVIGTHALIQAGVDFNHLGLVVIDEQHRFGVSQRQTLLDKGHNGLPVNLLQMTATPIPRTLALSLYGEMTVATIDELPGGRKPIQTLWMKDHQMTNVYDIMQQELAKNHQVYFVLPLIDSSEHMGEVENVTAVYDRLLERFPEYNIGVMHGQLHREEQAHMMELFINNDVQILVATTMVEVGVDVPNATVMVIQSAERFGLAQLHQLRGRVGRSDLPSYCLLIAQPTTPEGQQRMEIITQHQDGFLISQEDMKIRGVGELLGESQSGLPKFHYADIFQDQHILEVARQDVTHLLGHAERLTPEEFDQLMSVSQQRIDL